MIYFMWLDWHIIAKSTGYVSAQKRKMCSGNVWSAAWDMTVFDLLFSVLFCDVECILWSDRLWTVVHRAVQCSMYDTRWLL